MAKTTLRETIAAALVALAMLGCHAAPDDAVGQAGELMDATRRENALTNLNRLYDTARRLSSESEGNTAEQEFDDATVAPITQAYLNTDSDRVNQYRILELLARMADPRAMEAYLKALDYQPEVTEAHATLSAQTLRRMELTDEQKGQAITALGEALERVQGNRQEHNTLRREAILTLGAFGDRAATPILNRIATRVSEDQPLFINRAAADQIALLRDPESVDAMLQGLFIHQLVTSPRLDLKRMNVESERALVQIGHPAVGPLLEAMRGENQNVNRRAQQLLDTMGEHNVGAAAFNRELVVEEACIRALGLVGFQDALEPMTQMTNRLTRTPLDRDGNLAANVEMEDATIAQNAMTAMAQLNLDEAGRATMREALMGVYQRVPKPSRGDPLILAMESRDPEFYDWFIQETRREEEDMPQLRLLAFRGAALIADGTQAATVRELIEAEPGPAEGGFRSNFEEMEPALALATECGRDIACYQGHLDDNNAIAVQKALYMMAYLGRGNGDLVEPVLAKLNHTNSDVRLAVLKTLERVAPNGSTEAADRIAEMAEAGQGSRAWEQIKQMALLTMGRLRAWGSRDT